MYTHLLKLVQSIFYPFEKTLYKIVINANVRFYLFFHIAVMALSLYVITY